MPAWSINSLAGDDPNATWVHRLDVRTKMFICAAAAVATIALGKAPALALLWAVSFVYLASIRRPVVVAVAYGMMALAMAMSAACAFGMAHFMPSMGKGLTLAGLSVPFLRGMVVMNTVLPLGFTSRVQRILHSLQVLRLPFALYLPAAVMVRFIPTFASDIRQVWESLKLRGFRLNPVTCTLHPVLTTRLLFAPLLIRALKTSDDLGIAAELKGLGYSSCKPRFAPSPWKRADWIAAAVTVVAIVAAVVIQILTRTPGKGGMA